MKPDVIVIGAGHNGLVAAVRLARAGRRVLVLERRKHPGGLCAALEFHPGYRVPGLLHDSATVRPWVTEDLQLSKYGLAWQEEDTSVFAPAAEGPGVVVRGNSTKGQFELEGAGPGEAAAYGQYRRFLEDVGGFVAGLLDRPPPPVAPASLGDLLKLGHQGLALRRLGRAKMTELLRVLPMSAADWLRERFTSGALAECLAAPALLGTFLGPRSAGCAANLLFYESSRGRLLRGGPAALIEALEAACREYRVELRTAACVERIRVQSGQVQGVTLDSGEEIDAAVVAASCDPKQTFLRLVPAAALPVRLERALGNFRSRGTTAKVHLALSGPLEFPGREGAGFEAIRIGGGDLDHLERAFDAVKYRRVSPVPHLDIRVPTVADPALAPRGHHVASIVVSFVPYELEGGWNEPRRQSLGDTVVEVLARHSPALHHQIVARQVLTPKDLEEGYGLTGGHLHHGEHALDQLLTLRPTPSCARYGTPVGGLFLAGSGSHPGGGVSAVPGALAAEAILRAGNR